MPRRRRMSKRVRAGVSLEERTISELKQIAFFGNLTEEPSQTFTETEQDRAFLLLQERDPIRRDR